MEAVKAVELIEAFVLTGNGFRYSKRARSYGRPNNRYLQGATSTVQGATSVRNGVTMSCDFLKCVHGFETKRYPGAPLSSDGKLLTGHGDPVFTEKIHVTKKRRVKNFHDPIEVRIGFFGYQTNQ